MTGTPDNNASPGGTPAAVDNDTALTAHRAGLQALRGAAYTGATYAAPEPVVDPRTPEVKAFDSKYGPPAGGYDLNLGGLENVDGQPVSTDAQIAFRTEAETALKALGMPRVAGNSLIEECLTAGRQYQAMSPADRAAWTERQNAVLEAMPNGAELIKQAEQAFATLKATNPKLAIRLSTNGGGMSAMAVVQLALQVQRNEQRARLAGSKP